MNRPTEADLDLLEQYLSAPERPESTLPLDATQGLLCAVVSAPAPVMPGRWREEIQELLRAGQRGVAMAALP